MKETSKKEGKEEGHLHSSDGVAPDLTGVETLSVRPKHESMESSPPSTQRTRIQDCLDFG